MTEGSSFSPYRMLEIELSAPIPDIAVEQDEDGQIYRRAMLLVRLHSRPLASIEVDLPQGRLAAADLAAAVWSNLQPEIEAHLRTDGLPEVSRLDPAGLQSVSQPACVRPRLALLSDAPFVSILIATRDRPETLGRCLDSLLGLEYPNYEIVVVDNAPSNTATADYIAARFTGRSRVRYFLEDRPGLACAHNRGLEEVTAPYIAITDDDVTVDRFWLAELMAGFEAAPNVGCVTGMIYPSEIHTEAQYWVEQSVGYSKGYKPALYDLGDNRPAHPLFPYTAGMFGSGANMAFKTSALRKTGIFDDRLGAGSPGMGGDDLAAFFQIVVHGYTLVYQPTAIVYHSHHRTVEKLRRQAYGYGAGLGAYLTKTIMDYPGRLFQFAVRVPFGIYYLYSKKSAKNRRLSNNYPSELVRLERRGLFAGSYAYLKNRLRSPVARKSGSKTMARSSYPVDGDQVVER